MAKLDDYLQQTLTEATKAMAQNDRETYEHRIRIAEQLRGAANQTISTNSSAIIGSNPYQTTYRLYEPSLRRVAKGFVLREGQEMFMPVVVKHLREHVELISVVCNDISMPIGQSSVHTQGDYVAGFTMRMLDSRLSLVVTRQNGMSIELFNVFCSGPYNGDMKFRCGLELNAVVTDDPVPFLFKRGVPNAA